MSASVLGAAYHWAKATPNHIAISTGSEHISYAALADAIATTVQTLAAYEGQCVALDMDNIPGWIITDLACVAAGVATLPLPSFFTEAQRNHALLQVGAAAIIGNGFAIKPLKYAAQQLPQHTAKITYTSGTTGTPKGVCLSQAGMEHVASSLLQVIGHAPAKRTAAVLPLGVLLENIAGAYTTLFAGGCYDIRPQAEIGLAGQPDFVALTNYLYESEATSCILVPELLRGLMQAMAQTGIRLPEMEFMAVGGSKVALELLHKASALGLPVYQGYGLSECASVVAVNTPNRHHIGSVGKPLPHIDLQTSDDGEVRINTPAFLGYLEDKAAPTSYATGDLGYLDESGYLHITGRKKNVLITSYGRNISPEWPESELLSQPEIAQCIVVGDAAPSLSALLVPSLPLLPQAKLDAAVTRANSRLPDYAQIKQWRRVAPFTAAEGLLTGTNRPKRTAIMHAHHTLIEAFDAKEPHANIL